MRTIFIKKEPILLGQFLKFSGIITNGGEAKIFLSETDVKVNKIPENRRGKKLFDGDIVEIDGKKFQIVLETN